MEIFNDKQLHESKTALLNIILDEKGHYECKVIAQYSRQTLNSLQVGDLIAAENFRTCEQDVKSYSILSISSMLPTHFAAQDENAYPGHLFESMRSITAEWKAQESRPKFATTTIALFCVPTGLQFNYESKSTTVENVELEIDDMLPMIGSEMRPLTKDMVEKIVNGPISNEGSPLSHKRLEDLRVSLEKTSLVTTHMGIFGFTNSGKSNLTSSLISYLVEKNEVNLVIIDPNDEYVGLLSDLIMSNPEKFFYIHTDEDSLPRPVLLSLDGDKTKLPDKVKELFISQLKLPKGLKHDSFISALTGNIDTLAKKTRLGLTTGNVVDKFEELINRRIPGNFAPQSQDAINNMIDDLMKDGFNKEINYDNINELVTTFDTFGNKYKGDFSRKVGQSSDGKSKTAWGVFLGAIDDLKKYRKTIKDLRKSLFIDFNSINDFLNDKGPAGKIMIVSGRRDTSLKLFSSKLGDELYESRRIEGNTSPSVFFLLDEADLFIPNEDKDEMTEAMKRTCVTIARRGRKFGIGLGIATQRASMLDTQIMGNLHTYFISKLPRKYDREKVAEAFGIGEEQLNQIFSFKPGNWLLISHDSTGLRSVPIPVYADNADERVLGYFKKIESKIETKSDQ